MERLVLAAFYKFVTLKGYREMKVKLKSEIVTMGVEGVSPVKSVGTYVSKEEWNKIISDPEALVIDIRNDYEYAIGTFKNAVNPKTDIFKEFPEYVNKSVDKAKHRKVAMFCTGGIRCERETALLKDEGFEEVYHLEGGILQYLEDMKREDSRGYLDIITQNICNVSLFP